MQSRRSRFPYPFTTWRRTFVLIPAVVVVALAAARSASAATSPTPIVTTGLVYNVGSGSAVVGGTVNSNGEAATYHFDYGTSTNYTSQTISEPIVDTTPELVDAGLTGLSPNIVYHYRIEATDAWGTSYGADQTFTTTGGTQSSPPAVATGSASGVGADSATVAGTVNPNGAATTYHFDYGTSTNYTSQAPAPPGPSAGSGTATQTESATLTGLSPNIVYHYRIEATNPWGTSYGADQTLTTGTGTSGSPSPLASFTAIAVVIHNKCGFTGMFNASASLPAKGTSITQYAWSFGDGSSAVTTSPQAFHGYHTGTYHVVLTVTDADGTSASASRAISGGSGSLYCR
jgi:phosphodiesterase/alkaline phosphatase D-like protein